MGLWTGNFRVLVPSWMFRAGVEAGPLVLWEELWMMAQTLGQAPLNQAVWFVYDLTKHTFKRKEREVGIWNCYISE